jgi:hypothetical protein
MQERLASARLHVRHHAHNISQARAAAKDQEQIQLVHAGTIRGTRVDRHGSQPERARDRRSVALPARSPTLLHLISCIPGENSESGHRRPIRMPVVREGAEAELGRWSRLRAVAGCDHRDGPLSVGGLLAVGVSGECVEASISDEPFDRWHGRSYPGPVWVGVCCDAPRVV